MKYEDKVCQLLRDSSDIHLLSGLSSECGEVCAVYQKSIYKDIPLDINNLIEELGDVLFYITAIATKYGKTLSDLQEININKLINRHNLELI